MGSASYKSIQTMRADSTLMSSLNPALCINLFGGGTISTVSIRIYLHKHKLFRILVILPQPQASAVHFIIKKTGLPLTLPTISFSFLGKSAHSHNLIFKLLNRGTRLGFLLMNVTIVDQSHTVQITATAIWWLWKPYSVNKEYNFLIC